MTTTETEKDTAPMNKNEIAVQVFLKMMEKDWNFPYDPDLAESQSDQWDVAATQRALKIGALLAPRMPRK